MSTRGPAYIRRPRVTRPVTRRVCIGPLCLGAKEFLSQHPGHRVCAKCEKRIIRLCQGSSPKELFPTRSGGEE